jgi:hypothetical protein
MEPSPLTIQLTATFAVNCRVAPAFTVAPVGETNTTVLFEPLHDESAANRQPSERRTTTFFNPGAPGKNETKDETKLLATKLKYSRAHLAKEAPKRCPDVPCTRRRGRESTFRTTFRAKAGPCLLSAYAGVKSPQSNMLSCL